MFCEKCSAFKQALNPQFPRILHRVCAACLHFLKKRENMNKQQLASLHIDAQSGTLTEPHSATRSVMEECPGKFIELRFDW